MLIMQTTYDDITEEMLKTMERYPTFDINPPNGDAFVSEERIMIGMINYLLENDRIHA